MTTTAPVRPDKTAPDLIRDLVQGFTTAEWVTQPTRCDDGKWRTKRRLHTVTHPPLLDQIEQTVTSSTTGGQVFQSAYGSKPAGRLDCLALLHRIDHQSRRLAEKLHLEPEQPLRRRMLALSGALGDRPHATIKSWWATARVLTQHDSAPFAPNEPCPDCDQRGTLRIRFDPKVAVCVECQSIWDEADGRFGRLAIWVEWASKHLHGPRHMVPATDYDTALGYDPDLGYDTELGYVEVCGECEHERLAMATREASKLLAPRSYDAPEPVSVAG